MLKFRGRSIIGNRTLYGDLLHNSGESLILESPKVPAQTVNSSTVSQMIGWDKLGTAVYSDDQLITDSGETVLVSEQSIPVKKIGTYKFTKAVVKFQLRLLMEKYGFNETENIGKADSTYYLVTKGDYNLLVNCLVYKDSSYQFDFYLQADELKIQSDIFPDISDEVMFRQNYESFNNRIQNIWKALRG